MLEAIVTPYHITYLRHLTLVHEFFLPTLNAYGIDVPEGHYILELHFESTLVPEERNNTACFMSRRDIMLVEMSEMKSPSPVRDDI